MSLRGVHDTHVDQGVHQVTDIGQTQQENLGRFKLDLSGTEFPTNGDRQYNRQPGDDVGKHQIIRQPGDSSFCPRIRFRKRGRTQSFDDSRESREDNDNRSKKIKVC